MQTPNHWDLADVEDLDVEYLDWGDVAATWTSSGGHTVGIGWTEGSSSAECTVVDAQGRTCLSLVLYRVAAVVISVTRGVLHVGFSVSTPGLEREVSVLVWTEVAVHDITTHVS